ncbi:Aladin [Toxocara canis]|uniref:Aladin n=1 Tax=Toxocara canis TaxID=6265 RepID=A0A0B2V6G9_TOXCA|nr:Aladin [Toxocara canis]
MSFLEFPPLGQEERPYALHEMNGRVAYGSAEEVEVVSKSGLLCDYPKVDKKQLQTLQHSMSRESVRRVFNERESNRFQQAVDVWQRNGTRGLLEFMGNVCEGSRFAWPLTGAVRLLRKAEEEVRGAFMLSEEKICDMIAGVSTNLNWKSNWIRCLAFHDDGHCLAICQPSDHIRIYSVGAVSRTPITLKHIRQKNVAQMAWKPFDAMVLAVACEDAVLVWRLNPKALTSRPPAQCAQVLEVGASFSPVTQCIWDHILSSAVFIVSPSSSRLLIIDTTTGESESVGGWIGPRIRRIWSSPDHSKLLVSYYSDTIRVYDRSCWEEEKWTGLFGGCVAAVWSPDCSCLLFSNHDRPSIYSIRFANRIEQNADKQHILRSYGADTPIEVFNLSEGSCEEEGEERMRVVGGRVHDMQLSADGKRLAVAFKG